MKKTKIKTKIYTWEGLIGYDKTEYVEPWAGSELVPLQEAEILARDQDDEMIDNPDHEVIIQMILN